MLTAARVALIGVVVLMSFYPACMSCLTEWNTGQTQNCPRRNRDLQGTIENVDTCDSLTDSYVARFVSFASGLFVPQ